MCKAGCRELAGRVVAESNSLYYREPGLSPLADPSAILPYETSTLTKSFELPAAP